MPSKLEMLAELAKKGINLTKGSPATGRVQALSSKLSDPARTQVLPMPNRWFLSPEKFPHVQPLVEKVLKENNMQRGDFFSGAFVDPKTGKILDFNVMKDVGVVIDPVTNRPKMSGLESGVGSFLDIPETMGPQTKSNLVRKGLFKSVGGDPLLNDINFLATVERSGAGHQYGLGTEYATPTEMLNTMTGDNPTLRPHSRGDLFGVGDVVGQIVTPQGKPTDVYESLLIAPKGSDVEGVRLHKKAVGGNVSQDAMHMAVMNQKVQKKARGDLVEESIKEAKSKQEAPPKVVSPVTKESQFEKDFRQYLANQQAAREQVATELPSRLVKGAIPGAAGAIAGYAAQIPGTAGDIASLYQELKPESWRDLPDVVQALPTTERIQQYFLPEEKTSPELQAGITGGNIAALGQGIASLPAAAKGIAKGATAGSKALANEAAYRIYQAMERGEGALAPMLAGVAPRKMIPAWHGSPHDIPMGRSMLMEKIGTGEGAQAYGHGLYAAETRDVGKSYQPRSPKYEENLLRKYNQAQRSSDYPTMEILEDAMLHRTADEILEKYSQGEYSKQHINAAKQFANWYKKNPPEVGGLYKLELSHPDPAKEAATPLSPNDFLHWDKPLSEQPESVRKAIEKIRSELHVPYSKINEPLGFFVGKLGDAVGGHENAAKLMNNYGIPGIRYLDQGSRGAGEGTYNYVLFDPKLANIVGKEKEGGVIHKAEGGITSDDLIIEENPL